MLVELPNSLYHQYNSYTNNGQSALLQDVKNTIARSYPSTKLKGDGQIVSVSFSDGIDFEVLPAFVNKDGKTYTFANSNSGGSWKTTDPRSEIDACNEMNKATNKNYKRLCRMARAWKDKRDVSISGFLIDILAYRFIKEWECKTNSFSFYDWMSRDFFKYLNEQDANQTTWYAMGSALSEHTTRLVNALELQSHSFTVEAY